MPREALRGAARRRGSADPVLVKPAGTLLDVIQPGADAVRGRCRLPVSGEVQSHSRPPRRALDLSAPRCSRRSPGSGAAGLGISSSSTSQRNGVSGCARERTGARVETVAFLAASGGKRSAPPSGSCSSRALSAEYSPPAPPSHFDARHAQRPDLAAEVTLQPLRRFEPRSRHPLHDIIRRSRAWRDLAFEPGPVVRDPFRTDAQIDALPALVPAAGRAVLLGRPSWLGARERAARGAPHRLAARLSRCCAPRVREALEGVRGGAHFPVAPSTPRSGLLERARDAMAEYLRAAGAGAPALMLFESWASLGVREFSSLLCRVAAQRRWLRAPACPSSTT